MELTPEIQQMLVLSTAHVTEETATMLDRAEANFVRYGKAEYGWFIPILDDPQPDMPADLQACVAYAKTHGCTWIMFDCDALTVDDLPTYDW